MLEINFILNISKLTPSLYLIEQLDFYSNIKDWQLLKQIIEWFACVFLCRFFVMYVTDLYVCVCIFCIIVGLRTNSYTAYCNGQRQFMALVVCIFCRIARMRISFCFGVATALCFFLHNFLVCRWHCVIVMVMTIQQNCRNENLLLLVMALCFVFA